MYGSSALQPSLTMSDELLDNLLDDVRLTQKLFQEDRVTEAYFLLQNIERFTRELHPELQSAIDKELNNSDLIKNLRAEGIRNAKLLALFEDGESWNDWTSGVGTSQDVIVGIHKEEERGQYYFKVEGRVQCDLLHVLAALLENELYRFWMPMCTFSRTVAALSPFRRLVHTKLDFALLQKESVYVAHGDLLPDGGVLITMTPSTEGDENSHACKAMIGTLPPRDARLDISGGLLLYEELEDSTGKSLNAAASEYEAHSERLQNRTFGGHQAKVLRRKTQSSYSKQYSFNGNSPSGGSPRALDLHTVATMSLANDKEYKDRMLTLGKKHRTTRHMTEKQSLAAQTLDRYKLSIQQLYGKQCLERIYHSNRGWHVWIRNAYSEHQKLVLCCAALLLSSALFSAHLIFCCFSGYLFCLLCLAEVQPHVGGVAGSTGLADTSNPMMQGRKLTRNAPSNHSIDSLAGGGKSKSAFVGAEKRIVLVKGIFRIDPKLNFMPDWM